MFRGLLNRVKVDLVRTYLKRGNRTTINEQQRPMEGAAQVSVRPCYNIQIAVLSASLKWLTLLERCSK
jgi:hypothetical protein